MRANDIVLPPRQATQLKSLALLMQPNILYGKFNWQIF